MKDVGKAGERRSQGRMAGRMEGRNNTHTNKGHFYSCPPPMPSDKKSKNPLFLLDQSSR